LTHKQESEVLKMNEGVWCLVRRKKIRISWSRALKIEKTFPEYRAIDFFPEIKAYLEKKGIKI